MPQEDPDPLGPTMTMAASVVTYRKKREIKPHYFEQEQGTGAPKQFVLDGDEFVIGRAEDAAIRVLTPKASRQHAIIRRRGTEFTIFDNESRNGVYLNGLRINSAILRDGDVIQVTTCVYVYHER